MTLFRGFNLISHRGPDDEGFYFGKNFAFGHRRLSILDLSSNGHQPMHYLGKYIITYNGEVYNYLEIKEELKKMVIYFILILIQKLYLLVMISGEKSV